MKDALIQLFDRDIQRLCAETEAFPTERSLWELRTGISNSGGNLVLHLCGNLNHFIGAMLGDTGYVRDRAAEFTTRNVPKKELLDAVTRVKAMVLQTLEALPEDRLRNTYPLEPLGYAMTTEYFLIYLSGHLNYHLGQINYHRRLLQDIESAVPFT